MAQYDEDEMFDDDIDSDLPKKLRSQIKQLQSEKKEMQEALESFRSEQRKQVIGGALESRGLNPKIAAFIPSDLEPDSIDGWIEEYADVFGAAPAEPASDPRAQEINRMSAVEDGAAQSVPQDLLAQINQAENMDELMSALRSAG